MREGVSTKRWKQMTHVRLALRLIARLYAVEERAKTLDLSAEQGRLPKSSSGAAVRYALNQWEALTRFLEDGELEIDIGATDRANRNIAVGRGNWAFFRQRQRRQDCVGTANLHRFLQEVWRGAVHLVSRCALPQSSAPNQPA
jgi:hypothetical protein